jgi:hypothetical protein
VEKSRLIYTSQATKAFSKRDLLDLLHDARAYNSIDSITGFLYYKNGLFFQVIEGESEKVDDLFKRIKRDRRHCHVEVILKESIEELLFNDWSMGCIELENSPLSALPGLQSEVASREALALLTQHLPQISSLLISNPELNLTN